MEKKSSSLHTIFDINVDTDSDDSTYFPSESESESESEIDVKHEWEAIESLDPSDHETYIDDLPIRVKKALIRFFVRSKKKKT